MVKATTPDQKFLRIPEAAAYIGVPTQTMQRICRDKALPTYRPGGRKRSRIYISTKDLDALMTAARQEAASGPLAPERKK